jgi:hypothetical protein
MYLEQPFEALPLKDTYDFNESSPPKPSYFNQLLYDVAISTIKEAVLSVAMVTVTGCFVASYAIPCLISSAITLIAINALVRLVGAMARYALHQLEQNNSNHTLVMAGLQVIDMTCQGICPLTFAYFENVTTANLIHEAGHASAIRSVYQKANPMIEIFPWDGGSTSYRAGALTNFGKWIGANNSEVLITAAGPAFAIITATIQIIFSHRIQKDNPEASKALLASAVVNIASHVKYAVSALWKTSFSPAHDFQVLWKIANIHPLAAAATMVALPIFAKMVLVGIDRL